MLVCKLLTLIFTFLNQNSSILVVKGLTISYLAMVVQTLDTADKCWGNQYYCPIQWIVVLSTSRTTGPCILNLDITNKCQKETER